MTRTEIFDQILWERTRQERKFPNRTPASYEVSPETKLLILTEEVGEVARAILDEERAERLKEELTQVAAVAVAWLESL